MRKYIIILLSSATIVICGWLITNRVQFLDIPSNKNDFYAIVAKREIQNRTDIDECEKKIRIYKIEEERARKRYYSNTAFQTQTIAFAVILIQIILLTTLLLPPIKKIKHHKKKYAYILGLLFVTLAFMDFTITGKLYSHYIISWIIGVILILLSNQKLWVKILTSSILPIIIAIHFFRILF